MQNHQNGEIQYPAESFLKELQRCEKIFKTRPCLEILAPIENRKSRVDDVNFKRISNGILRQVSLMQKMDRKLSEFGKSLREAKDLTDDMDLKFDIPK